MSDYVSINIQEIEPAQSVHHSMRTKKVTYLVANPNTVTNFRHDLELLNDAPDVIEQVAEYFKFRKLDINEDYKKHTNNRNIPKNTKLYQEAIISFGRERFEQNNQADILKATEDFCIKFENKYGCKILMTSLHLDEGHKNENGTIQHNYHTHLLIENYNFNTHKTCLQKLDYRKLQTELAQSFEHLGFERGDPEKKAIRLEHRQYRTMKEHEALSLETKNQNNVNSSSKLTEKAKEEISATVQNMVADAFNEGRNSFALGLESLNNNALRSVALKSIKLPEKSIKHVGYKPDKSNVLATIEQSIQADSSRNLTVVNPVEKIVKIGNSSNLEQLQTTQNQANIIQNHLTLDFH